MKHNKTERGLRCSNLAYMLVILPAVALGIVTMIVEGISPVLWGQQAAAFVIFTMLGLLGRCIRKAHAPAWLVLMLALLAATLLFPAVGGARRWLDLGLINVNAAMLVLPALILLAGNLKRPYPVLLLAGLILCMQPDFSQLAAFSIGALPMLWERRKNRYWAFASVILMAIFAIRCFNVAVDLEPVEYCEGIMNMMGKRSLILMIAGGIAIAFIPGYFLYRFFRDKSMMMLCLALYYMATILFSLTGEYPVPFMGFGLSPIAGYWIALMVQKE